MANADFRFGLKPVQHLNGAPWNGQTRRCVALSTYATALYVGDPVLWTGASDASGYPVVQKATAGATNKITGVIVSFEPNPSYPDDVYGRASTAREINVCFCDPSVVYEIQGCSGAALATTTTGLNAVLIASHSGDTTTGLSGIEMDSGAATAPAADATYQLTIIGAPDRPDNDITTVNAKWYVVINLPSIAPATAGV